MSGSSGIRGRAWRAFGVGVVALVAASCALPFSPVGRLVFGAAWVQTPHMAAQREILAEVPAGVCVAADDRLVPPLIRLDRVTVPSVPAPRTDYLLLDLSEPEATKVNDVSIRTDEVYAHALAAGYRQVAHVEDLVLLQAPDYAGPTPECAP